MNVFLTTLMHPSTASDFKTVEANFVLSAKTVCGQTNQDFKYIVVCNSIPDIKFEHPNLEYVVVDFPHAKMTELKSKRQDKAAKLIIGLLYSAKFNVDYVFICDADDWIAPTINEFLTINSSDIGFLANKGYLLDLNKGKYLVKYGLYRFCGSTYAIKYKKLMGALAFDKTLSIVSKKADILALVPDDIIFSLLNGHGYKKYFKARGLIFEEFPFASVAWVRNTGNNVREDAQDVPGISITYNFLHQFNLQDAGFKIKPTNSMYHYFTFYKLAIISWIGNRLKGDHR